ncbi:MAG: NDP-sugar synthase [Acidobacteria bacterium]|nr:NDP-sugar synthase [Acidobacteriota bacterium]MCW5970912.1 NDP-sugar synthase [Blastocatellales bacterium]
MQALILAGGKGTKLRPLTIHTPKPVVPVVNRPFLLYQVDLLKRAGIKDIILSLSYQPGKIEEILADGQDFGVRIRYAHEPLPLGTAGAYRNASEFIDRTAVVLNGDILTSLDLNSAISFHQEKNSAATIVATPVENPAGFGLVETDADGRVIKFREKPRPEEITVNTVNAGLYILEPEILQYIPEDESCSFETNLFPKLLEIGAPFYSYIWDGYWIDIGEPPRYMRANLDLLAGLLPGYAPERMPTGGGEDSPRIDALSVVDPSCVLKPNVEIINSVLGPNCIIEDRVRIEDSVLWAGTRVGTGATVLRSFVGRSGLIGRNVEIDGAVLGDKSSLTDHSTV